MGAREFSAATALVLACVVLGACGSTDAPEVVVVDSSADRAEASTNVTDASLDVSADATDASIEPDDASVDRGSTDASSGADGSCAACRGQAATEMDVSCETGMCVQTCRGENFDVNGNPDDGCEAPDDVSVGHTQNTASSRGSKSCADDTSSDSFSGRIPSDTRVHANPPVAGFDVATGSAPDHWSVLASGGAFCVDDYNVTFTTKDGGDSECYRCTIVTNQMSQSITVNGHGSGTVTSGSGAYSDGTTIFFVVEKICSAATPENVTYTVTYHL